ncbi:hypothetical protein KDH_45180 [Dictyobacter sp. S3.2.2.5]|uniref:Uncharacterized protein n=1 Tax=Dictyobacter halimunensis TaxID=3026934 RepID=A0ABQ6FTT8_9CHLR|nr:hypothetical protein KDH_45180 [Dictyobacter sp. S3.2.2.5]
MPQARFSEGEDMCYYRVRSKRALSKLEVCVINQEEIDVSHERGGTYARTMKLVPIGAPPIFRCMYLFYITGKCTFLQSR